MSHINNIIKEEILMEVQNGGVLSTINANMRQSAPQYKIFSVNGQCTINGQPVKRCQQVNGNDVISVPANCGIAILNNAQKKVYTTGPIQPTKVIDLVSNIVNNQYNPNVSYASKLAKMLFTGAVDNQTYNSVGATYR